MRPACLANQRINYMNTEEMTSLAVSALEDLKGIDIVILDIADKSSIADNMLVATGSSQRHVSSLGSEVRKQFKDAGHLPLGVEGDNRSDWVLVDLGDVIVHVMTPEMRDFYALEKLWSLGPDQADQDSAVLTPV